ncbi:hypothetical protein PsorP6_001162 [Peronosclerospora sorghi]|uniref:Uncharacterized protein n=1 Tax=Peronosclerospora sorghi TaxID=230839 RepID=A0ACC0WSA5_9STRA|nr:hypothetical protein PsorP6_001162 [Peronosclerospora sorghi]
MQLLISVSKRQGRISRKDTEVAALLGCYQTALLELEAKQASGLCFIAVSKEQERIISTKWGSAAWDNGLSNRPRTNTRT